VDAKWKNWIDDIFNLNNSANKTLSHTSPRAGIKVQSNCNLQLCFSIRFQQNICILNGRHYRCVAKGMQNGKNRYYFMMQLLVIWQFSLSQCQCHSVAPNGGDPKSELESTFSRNPLRAGSSSTLSFLTGKWMSKMKHFQQNTSHNYSFIKLKTTRENERNMENSKIGALLMIYGTQSYL
jgi:hypothetical protein